MDLPASLKTAGEACEHKSTHLRTRGPMMNELATMGLVNRRAVKGILQTMMYLRPGCHKEHLTYCLVAANWGGRNRIREHYQREVDSVSHIIDVAFATKLAKEISDEGDDFSMNAWHGEWKDTMQQWLEEAPAITRLMAHQGETYLDVAEDLDYVCKSAVGQAMFGWARPKLVEERLAQIIDQTVQPPPGGGDVTADVVARWTQDVLVAAEVIEARKV